MHTVLAPLVTKAQFVLSCREKKSLQAQLDQANKMLKGVDGDHEKEVRVHTVLCLVQGVACVCRHAAREMQVLLALSSPFYQTGRQSWPVL